MHNGDRVTITQHVALYGMSLKGRTGRVVDVGEEWVTIEIDNWRVRVPIRCVTQKDAKPE